MTFEPSGRSLGQRAWAWLLGALAFLIVLNVAVTLVEPVLPYLIIAGVVYGAIYSARAWRRYRQGW